MSQRLGGMLPAAIGVGIKGQIDGSHAIAQLTKLVWVELSSHRAGNVVKAGLPQHGVVEQPFDQDHFWISADLLQEYRPPLVPGRKRWGGAVAEILRP